MTAPTTKPEKPHYRLHYMRCEHGPQAGDVIWWVTHRRKRITPWFVDSWRAIRYVTESL